MGDYSPVRANGATPFTAGAGAAITGGQLVYLSADNTVQAAATANKTLVIGVAAHDAASGAKVTVWPLANVVHEVVASGGIAAGAGVIAGGTAGEGATGVIGTEAALGSLLGICTKACGAGAGNKAQFIGRG